jgi:hypothetical protein
VSRRETRVRRNMKAEPKEILHAGLEAAGPAPTIPLSEPVMVRDEAS